MKASSSYDKLNGPSLNTKKDLIAWINDLLKINVKNIQDLANGAAFCQLIDILNPGKVRLQKIKWNAKLQHENLNNLKMLSVAMMQSGLDKNFEPTRIAQKKAQDILQLLQWFRKYFYTKGLPKQNYDAQSRRLSCQKKILATPTNLHSPLQKLKAPEKIQLKKPELSQKKESEIQDCQTLKNCLQMQKTIERIVFDQVTSPNLKIQIIKGIIFKGKGTEQTKTEMPIQASIFSTKEPDDLFQIKLEQSEIQNNYPVQTQWLSELSDKKTEKQISVRKFLNSKQKSSGKYFIQKMSDD